jgi:amino acid transporter
MNFICLAAQFYVALYPVGGPNLNPTIFFQDYLAGPFLIALYVIWKVWSWFKIPEQRPLYVKIKDIDVYEGLREEQLELINAPEDQRRQSIMEMQSEKKVNGPLGWAKSIVQAII